MSRCLQCFAFPSVLVFVLDPFSSQALIEGREQAWLRRRAGREEAWLRRRRRNQACSQHLGVRLASPRGRGQEDSFGRIHDADINDSDAARGPLLCGMVDDLLVRLLSRARPNNAPPHASTRDHRAAPLTHHSST